MPLVRLANRRDVNRVSGLQTTIGTLGADTLVEAYLESIDMAPSRPSRGRRYFVDHTGVVPGPSGRQEEHLAIALVNDSVPLVISDDVIRLLDYQVPLKATRADPGVGKADLVGHGEASGALWVIELKVKPRSGRGDTSLRGLLEALTYGAVLEANWNHLVKEAAGRYQVTTAGAPNILVTGTSEYWNGWRTSSTSGNWLESLSDLISTLEQRLGRRIGLLDIGEVSAKAGKTVPAVYGLVRCRPVVPPPAPTE